MPATAPATTAAVIAAPPGHAPAVSGTSAGAGAAWPPTRIRSGMSNRASRRQPVEPGRVQRRDDHQHELAARGCRTPARKCRLKMASRTATPTEKPTTNMRAEPGGPALARSTLRRMSSSSRTDAGQRAEQVSQAGAAQPRVDDQRGQDEVGARVVQVVGEPAQRLGQRHPGVQPVHQRGQRLPEGGRGGPQRGRDRLLQPDRARDRVPQRLGPGGQPLQPGHGAPARRPRRRQPVPAQDQQRDPDAGDHPAGEPASMIGPPTSAVSPRAADAPCRASSLEPAGRPPGGLGGRPRIATTSQEQPAAGQGPGQQRPAAGWSSASISHQRSLGGGVAVHRAVRPCRTGVRAAPPGRPGRG